MGFFSYMFPIICKFFKKVFFQHMMISWRNNNNLNNNLLLRLVEINMRKEIQYGFKNNRYTKFCSNDTKIKIFKWRKFCFNLSETIFQREIKLFRNIKFNRSWYHSTSFSFKSLYLQLSININILENWIWSKKEKEGEEFEGEKWKLKIF